MASPLIGMRSGLEWNDERAPALLVELCGFTFLDVTYGMMSERSMLSTISIILPKSPSHAGLYPSWLAIQL